MGTIQSSSVECFGSMRSTFAFVGRQKLLCVLLSKDSYGNW